MVNFRKMMFVKFTSEEREKWLEFEDSHARCNAKHAAMDTETLITAVRYCTSQMSEDPGFSPRSYGPGAPIYNATFWHTMYPEILKRLRKLEQLERQDLPSELEHLRKQISLNASLQTDRTITTSIKLATLQDALAAARCEIEQLEKKGTVDATTKA